MPPPKQVEWEAFYSVFGARQLSAAERYTTARWRYTTSYLGLLVNALGWGLAFRAGVGVLLTALMLPPLLARIRAEERLLRTQFGDEYGAYCARTARLIPGLY